MAVAARARSSLPPVDERARHSSSVLTVEAWVLSLAPLRGLASTEPSVLPRLELSCQRAARIAATDHMRVPRDGGRARGAAASRSKRPGPDASQRRGGRSWLCPRQPAPIGIREGGAVLDGLAAWLGGSATAALRSTVVAGPDAMCGMKVLAREATGVACARDAAGMLALRWRDMEGKLRCEARPLPVCDGVPDATVRGRGAAAQLAIIRRWPQSCRFRVAHPRCWRRVAPSRSRAAKILFEVATTPSITRAPKGALTAGPLETDRRVCARAASPPKRRTVLERRLGRSVARAAAQAIRAARAQWRVALPSCPPALRRRGRTRPVLRRAGRAVVTGSVSLFGNTGRPGAPRSMSAAMAGRTAFAVRPPGDALCDAFCVVPCARERSFAASHRRHAGFARFFGACERLGLAHPLRAVLALAEQRRRRRTDACVSARQARIREEGARATRWRERAMLAALRLDLGSQRTTLGDARDRRGKRRTGRAGRVAHRERARARRRRNAERDDRQLHARRRARRLGDAER